MVVIWHVSEGVRGWFVLANFIVATRWLNCCVFVLVQIT